MKLPFSKKIRILVVGDVGAKLNWLEGRLKLFWPPEVPAKIVVMACFWGDEVIEAVREFRPDILVLFDEFREEEGAAREVVRWIDEEYPTPLLVAVHSERREEEVRSTFAGADCVRFFICGERVRDFVHYCFNA